MCWYDDDGGFLDADAIDEIERIKYDIRRKEREEEELIDGIKEREEQDDLQSKT